MTHVDKEVVRRFVQEFRDAVDEVKDIVSMDLDMFIASRRARFSLRYAIITVVESLADLAVAILVKDFDEEASSYREAFEKLAKRGVISVESLQTMVKLVALRNLIVHRYWSIDDIRVYREAKESGIKGLENVLREILTYVEAKDC